MQTVSQCFQLYPYDILVTKKEQKMILFIQENKVLPFNATISDIMVLMLKSNSLSSRHFSIIQPCELSTGSVLFNKDAVSLSLYIIKHEIPLWCECQTLHWPEACARQSPYEIAKHILIINNYGYASIQIITHSGYLNSKAQFS